MVDHYCFMFIFLGCLFLLIRWKQIAGKYCAATQHSGDDMVVWHLLMQLALKSCKLCTITFKYRENIISWQLYTLEMAESIIQTNQRHRSVLWCSLPTFVTCGLCIFLSVDCFHTSYFMIRKRRILGETANYYRHIS